MLFNSLNFVVFLLAVFTIYVCLARRGQNLLLLAASYFFYSCWDWRFLILIIVSTLIDYVCGWQIGTQGSLRLRKIYLAISLASNLSILGFFKYFNFFIGSLERTAAQFGWGGLDLRLDIVLPVGISFYTFQTMSYTIDIFRGVLRPTRSFTDFAAYVAFFPQLVAGPIERAAHLLPQFEKERHPDRDGIRSGVVLMVWGLFKKVVIADNLAIMVDHVFGNNVINAPEILIAVYAFAFQIYCDFSGYSDMARGMSRCFGFDIMINFKNPYFSATPAEFWRRWHVSLSSWLRDYLYIPLGGNRNGSAQTYRNLMLTMLLGGLWHGAAWTFIVWGAFQGGLLVVWRRLNISRAAERIFTNGWICRTVLIVIMFHLMCMGWLAFRAESLRQMACMFIAFFVPWRWSINVLNEIIYIYILCVPLWMVQIWQERHQSYDQLPHGTGATVLASMMAIMFLMLGSTGSRAFVYFQF